MHIDGPSKPHLVIQSQVSSFFLTTSHRKVAILGKLFEFKNFPQARVLALSNIPIANQYASLILKFLSPFLTHRNMSLPLRVGITQPSKVVSILYLESSSLLTGHSGSFF
jgi:hypothetical protein